MKRTTAIAALALLLVPSATMAREGRSAKISVSKRDNCSGAS